MEWSCHGRSTTLILHHAYGCLKPVSGRSIRRRAVRRLRGVFAISLSQIPSTIAEICLPRTQISATEPIPDRGALILVVERNPVVQRLERYFLEQAGFAVEFANDGLAALARARELRPKILVTEILVPKLDGLSLCRAIKSEPETERYAGDDLQPSSCGRSSC